MYNFENFKNDYNYYGHSFYKSNFNKTNDRHMIQINIGGTLINRYIFGFKNNKPFFKYKNKKVYLLK